MTTPTSYSTAERLIQFAMEDAGLLGDGDTPTSEQFAKYTQRLNDLIGFWQTEGLKLWLQLDVSITLTAGKAQYTLKSGGDINMTQPTKVVDVGYYTDSSGNRRPITLISRDEYNRLGTVTQQGPINSYWPDKQQTQLAINFWMVPDTQAATGTAHIVVQQRVSRVVSITDSMNFPDEWMLAIRWGLANDICTGQPSAIIQRCERWSTYYRDKLDSFDVEDGSTKFQPDPQMVSQSRFR